MKVLIDELSVLLDAYDATGQQRDKRNKKTVSLLWQFYAGRSIRARTTEAGNPTWSYPHNCKGGKGVYMKDSSTATTRATTTTSLLGCSLLQTLWGPRAGPEARSRAKRRGTCLRAFAVRRRATPTARYDRWAFHVLFSVQTWALRIEPGRRDLLHACLLMS